MNEKPSVPQRRPKKKLNSCGHVAYGKNRFFADTENSFFDVHCKWAKTYDFDFKKKNFNNPKVNLQIILIYLDLNDENRPK